MQEVLKMENLNPYKFNNFLKNLCGRRNNNCLKRKQMGLKLLHQDFCFNIEGT